MIDVHSKYDDMYKNGIFYALICINNHIIACQNDMLLETLLDDCGSNPHRWKLIVNNQGDMEGVESKIVERLSPTKGR